MTTQTAVEAAPVELTNVRERRRAPRVELETAVNLFSDSNFFTGFTGDISEGGVFVVAYELQPVGTEVSVELGLPGGHEIKANGVVRWVRDPRDPTQVAPGMGIEFESLTDEDRAVIAEFVENRSPDFHI